MKKIFGCILALILVFTVAANAFAGGKPKIIQQPETMSVKKGGKVTFSIKTSGTVKTIIWYFVEPDGTEHTGKKLSKEVKDVKVVGRTNASKITLNKVPESMHGWTVYAHVNGNGYKIESDKVKLLISGLETPEETSPSKDTEPVPETKSEAQPEKQTDSKEQSEDQSSSEPEQVPEDESDQALIDNEPETITVTASSKILYKLDDPDTAYSSLEFVGSGSFRVSSEEPISSWTVNGIRFEPLEPIKEFKMTNVSSNISLDIKTYRASSSEIAVDESHMCKVTCSGCRFSYISGGLRSVTEGEVPAGARINIIADSSDYSKNGYVVNGGEAQSAGKASFQLSITDDTTIVCTK